MDRREFIKLAGSIIAGLAIAPVVLAKKAVAIETTAMPVTLQRTPTALDRVCVRRLLVYIKKEIKKSLKNQALSPIDAKTMATVENGLSGKLDQIKMRRGIVDYKVICDETNNTPKTMKRHELIADVIVRYGSGTGHIASLRGTMSPG